MNNRSKADKWAILGIASILILFGDSIFFNPIYVSHKLLARINFGEFHRLIRLAIVVAGGLLLFYAAQKILEKDD